MQDSTRGWVGCGILMVILLAVGGYSIYGWWTRTDVKLYVDNATNSAATVSVDGRKVIVVEPGSHGFYRLVSGKRRIVVEQDGEIVYDEAKTLKPGTQEEPTRYLVNVKGVARYRTYEVKYGVNFQPNFPKFNFPQIGQPDMKALAREDFRKLLEAVTFLPSAEWMDLDKIDHVLEREPEKVKGFVLASRKVLARVDRADYDAIEDARKHKDPTPEDALNLHKIVKRVLEAKPR